MSSSINTTRIALFGGVYSNYLALEATLVDARNRGVDAVYCLGDFGAFGPYPDRALELLRENNVACLQGNYDDSIGNELEDCQCGYTDPRDNHFAQLSYDYTLANTSADHKAWMRTLPPTRRLDLGGRTALLCHGSPRRVNEFLWESTTSTHFLDSLAAEYEADLMLVTHTGIKWQRELASGKQFVNVGVLGRPENDGTTNVWYTLLEVANDIVSAKFVPVAYDQELLAREMRAEQLPEEFVEAILTGWWTTCLEVLPSKERRRGRF
ncbi:metallophosphoesterase family protein [Adhaeretor mobilis]|uniref:Calcineurin-like phosphoesterase superfamily domain protein n=1 Tax=Adhaeretor mobilis TaxID=1930276 RepID=A0A517N0N6_9BACT|nr:metallophosphoesterase family protein [Adhaeretor mobilis]QDT00696.1 Calcineurin-like phosphoesterase superfamily domain protein [Adhaeretor mobilis]